MSPKTRAQEALLEHALSLPEAWQDHPWGETVVKVRKKVFVFLGRSEGPGARLSVKLPDSGLGALDESWTEPTGYGLGKSGWVTVDIEKERDVPLARLKGWIEESYRAVAPKKLVRELDGS